MNEPFDSGPARLRCHPLGRLDVIGADMPHIVSAPRLNSMRHSFLKNFGQSFYGPVDLRLVDDQGRSKAYRVSVGILGQHSCLNQAPDHCAGVCHVPMQLDPGEQAATAHLANDRAIDRREPTEQMCADSRGAFHQSLVDHMSRAASPTAAAIGLPPNVLP